MGETLDLFLTPETVRQDWRTESDIPSYYMPLARVYWQLRMRRPGRSTLYRKIAAEKKRLLLAGVPQIELHRVTRLLANPRSRSAQAMLARYLQDRASGVSPWHPPDE